MEKLKKLHPQQTTLSRATKKASTPDYRYKKKEAAIVKDFTFREFKKIADTSSFTQSEWSEILHISERTLQRYAKNNGIFSFSVADRILQIEKVLKKGIVVFGTNDLFMEWLRNNPLSLEGRLGLQSLASIDGIQQVLTELGRIEQGLFA